MNYTEQGNPASGKRNQAGEERASVTRKRNALRQRGTLRVDGVAVHSAHKKRQATHTHTHATDNQTGYYCSKCAATRFMRSPNTVRKRTWGRSPPSPVIKETHIKGKCASLLMRGADIKTRHRPTGAGNAAGRPESRWRARRAACLESAPCRPRVRRRDAAPRKPFSTREYIFLAK